MINRTELESILKINGVPAGSPEDKIRSVLLGARYTKDEVNEAIKLLGEERKPGTSQVSGLHKIFRTDEGLKPQEISQLLGIQVAVDQMPDQKEKNHTIPPVYLVFITIFSIIVALLAVLLYMYVYKLGPFHPEAGLAFFNGL